MLEEYIHRIFSVVKEWWGIETAVLSHEGLLYDYKGDRERAEELAALAPAELRSRLKVNYVLSGYKDKALFIHSKNSFTLVLEGNRVALSTYLEPLLRATSENSIKCKYCGRELDLETSICPRCGAKYSFTLASCPNCGYTKIHKVCPSCKKAIDYRGRAIVKDKLPLAVFSIGAGFMLLTSILIEPANIILGIGGALSLAIVGFILWLLAPIYRYKE